MSINAINGISLYEYYYTINNQEEKKKKSSPLDDELREYGITPTDNEALNVSLLAAAKKAEALKKDSSEDTIPYSERPWADLMYQLGIEFNEDPAQDIEDIKEEVEKLVEEFDDDEELKQDVLDLEDYAQQLYLSFQSNSSSKVYGYETLSRQLNVLSVYNKASLL